MVYDGDGKEKCRGGRWAGLVQHTYGSEQLALRIALEEISGRVTSSKEDLPVIVLTDSLSLVQACQTGRVRTPGEKAVLEAIAVVARQTPVLVRHCKSHVGIKGNEVANKIAIRAALQERPPPGLDDNSHAGEFWPIGATKSVLERGMKAKRIAAVTCCKKKSCQSLMKAAGQEKDGLYRIAKAIYSDEWSRSTTTAYMQAAVGYCPRTQNCSNYEIGFCSERDELGTVHHLVVDCPRACGARERFAKTVEEPPRSLAFFFRHTEAAMGFVEDCLKSARAKQQEEEANEANEHTTMWSAGIVSLDHAGDDDSLWDSCGEEEDGL